MMPIITIIGPYDYGKSTLLGRLLLETKSLPGNMVKNVKKQCLQQGIDFHPSYLIDHIREEREMKSTRERALAELKVGKDQILIIDTPGQLSLSRKMISGLTEASIVILMLDIKDEHLERYAFYFHLLSLLKIQHVILAINKMDTVEFRQKTYMNFLAELKKKCTIGKNFFILPISALGGENMTFKSPMLSWLKGETLYGYLKKIVCEEKKESEGKFILSVQSEIDKNGKNVTLGKVIQGKLEKKEKVSIFSKGLGQKNVIVENLFFNNLEVRNIKAEQNAGIILKPGLSLMKGDIIAANSISMRSERKIKSWFFVVDSLSLHQKNMQIRFLSDTQKIVKMRITKRVRFSFDGGAENVRDFKTKLQPNEFVEAEILLANGIIKGCEKIFMGPVRIALSDSDGKLLAIGAIIET